MSTVIKDSIIAIREAMKLADEVKKAGDSLKALAAEVRDHDKRLIRLEAKWETAMDFAKIEAVRSNRLIKPDNS